MHLKTNKSHNRQVAQALASVVICLYLTGCATKPWTDPLLEAEAGNTVLVIDQMVKRDQECGNTLDGDLQLSYASTLGKRAFNGYLQLSMPSSLLFVVSNPFGQPMFMVAADEKSFQSINTNNKKYLSGSLRSFFLLNHVPTFLLNERWGDWLTSRNSLTSELISEVRQDRELRGTWITFLHRKGNPVQKTHLLLDRDNTVFLERVLEDSSGKILAETHYSNWVPLGRCNHPLNIDITGLDYGTEVSLKLTNVRISEEKKEYTLSPPQGFNRQYMP